MASMWCVALSAIQTHYKRTTNSSTNGLLVALGETRRAVCVLQMKPRLS